MRYMNVVWGRVVGWLVDGRGQRAWDCFRKRGNALAD